MVSASASRHFEQVVLAQIDVETVSIDLQKSVITLFKEVFQQSLPARLNFLSNSFIVYIKEDGMENAGQTKLYEQTFNLAPKQKQEVLDDSSMINSFLKRFTCKDFNCFHTPQVVKHLAKMNPLAPLPPPQFVLKLGERAERQKLRSMHLKIHSFLSEQTILQPLSLEETLELRQAISEYFLDDTIKFVRQYSFEASQILKYLWNSHQVVVELILKGLSKSFAETEKNFLTSQIKTETQYQIILQRLQQKNNELEIKNEKSRNALNQLVYEVRYKRKELHRLKQRNHITLSKLNEVKDEYVCLQQIYLEKLIEADPSAKSQNHFLMKLKINARLDALHRIRLKKSLKQVKEQIKLELLAEDALLPPSYLSDEITSINFKDIESNHLKSVYLQSSFDDFQVRVNQLEYAPEAKVPIPPQAAQYIFRNAAVDTRDLVKTISTGIQYGLHLISQSVQTKPVKNYDQSTDNPVVYLNELYAKSQFTIERAVCLRVNSVNRQASRHMDSQNVEFILNTLNSIPCNLIDDSPSKGFAIKELSSIQVQTKASIPSSRRRKSQSSITFTKKGLFGYSKDQMETSQKRESVVRRQRKTHSNSRMNILSSGLKNGSETGENMPNHEDLIQDPGENRERNRSLEPSKVSYLKHNSFNFKAKNSLSSLQPTMRVLEKVSRSKQIASREAHSIVHEQEEHTGFDGASADNRFIRQAIAGLYASAQENSSRPFEEILLLDTIKHFTSLLKPILISYKGASRFYNIKSVMRLITNVFQKAYAYAARNKPARNLLNPLFEALLLQLGSNEEVRVYKKMLVSVALWMNSPQNEVINAFVYYLGLDQGRQSSKMLTIWDLRLMLVLLDCLSQGVKATQNIMLVSTNLTLVDTYLEDTLVSSGFPEKLAANVARQVQLRLKRTIDPNHPDKNAVGIKVLGVCRIVSQEIWSQKKRLVSSFARLMPLLEAEPSPIPKILFQVLMPIRYRNCPSFYGDYLNQVQFFSLCVKRNLYSLQDSINLYRRINPIIDVLKITSHYKLVICNSLNKRYPMLCPRSDNPATGLAVWRFLASEMIDLLVEKHTESFLGLINHFQTEK